MRTVQLQYGLPCEKPEDNILVTYSPKVIHFEIPINHPDIHKMSLYELVKKHAANPNVPTKVLHTPNNKIALPAKDQ